MTEYQANVSAFDFSPHTLWYYGLGLAGEAGEAVDFIKKIYRPGPSPYGLPVLSDAEKHKLVLELGDTLWYLTRIASLLGVTIGEIAQANIEKLTERRAQKGAVTG